ncbi:MAG TPA: PRC-barrel domain-containing protein [Hansschlegelia sp.]
MMFKTVEKGQADYLGSNLVGLDVYNGANEDVGEIKDMVFNGERKLTGLVVSVGGFLGMGSKYIIVDPAAVKLAHDDSKGEWTAKIDATKEQLTSAPEFKYNGKFDD